MSTLNVLVKEGEERGEKRGREEGEKKGREEGEKKGREEGKRNTAINLKHMRMGVDFIVTATRLSRQEVEDILLDPTL